MHTYISIEYINTYTQRHTHTCARVLTHAMYIHPWVKDLKSKNFIQKIKSVLKLVSETTFEWKSTRQFCLHIFLFAYQFQFQSCKTKARPVWTTRHLGSSWILIREIFLCLMYCINVNAHLIFKYKHSTKNILSLYSKSWSSYYTFIRKHNSHTNNRNQSKIMFWVH